KESLLAMVLMNKTYLSVCAQTNENQLANVRLRCEGAHESSLLDWLGGADSWRCIVCRTDSALGSSRCDGGRSLPHCGNPDRGKTRARPQRGADRRRSRRSDRRHANICLKPLLFWT